MARRMVKVRTCDRCPIGKEKPSTLTQRFSMGDTHWQIDLCEQHGAMFEREIYAWGRLGEEVEPVSAPIRFGTSYVEQARRVAELRTQQSEADRAARADEQAQQIVASAHHALPGAPSDADAYVFTDHARERLAERGVSVVSALWAASAPHVRRPGRQPGLMVHERNGTKVVLNPHTKAIITVAIVEEHRKAI